MPLNDFECLKCGEQSEYFYKHVDKSKLKCVKCKSKKLEVRFMRTPSMNFINTQERLNASLKKRSKNDHKKHYDDRLDAAKEKYKKAF